MLYLPPLRATALALGLSLAGLSLAGLSLAAPQDAAMQAPVAQDAVMQPTPPTARSLPVMTLPDTGAARRPQDRVSYMSEAQCQGLGGVVVDTTAKSCPGTAKACFTADFNGVIHRSCITK